MKTKYAVSLGLDCAMAGVLKDCKMRTFPDRLTGWITRILK